MSMQEFKSRFTALYSWVRGQLFTDILPKADVNLVAYRHSWIMRSLYQHIFIYREYLFARSDFSPAISGPFGTSIAYIYAWLWAASSSSDPI